MRILITGADSFVGKNLKTELNNRNYRDIYECNNNCDFNTLKRYVSESDFIFHLNTVYRSDNQSDFENINYLFTQNLIEAIGNASKSLLLLSSIQVLNDNPYGRSKLKAEECINNWAETTGNNAYIFRLANEFGKWCPPNFNSVIATFCHNIANGLDISINNPSSPLNLMYIDDIIDCFISVFEGGPASGYFEVEPAYSATVGEVAELLQGFHCLRDNYEVPDMEDGLIKRLYSTYLSYLPINQFSKKVQTHEDNRGSFTELLHFGGKGQVSLNISKPGITKGNHWHRTKNEKFIVIKGSGIIKLRKIGYEEIINYVVNGDQIEIVDIPPGYTHSITNIGEEDMLTIMWANEVFDREKPDTYFEEV